MNEDERHIAHDLFREMQYEIRNLKRNGTNPMFKSDYITLDTMLDAVKPLAYKHNFVLRQDMVNLQMLERVAVVTVCTSIIHKSGASFSSSVDIPTAKVDAHGVGGAITYGKRYSLANLFAITAESDDDGNSTLSQARPQQAPAPQQSYQPRQQRPISRPVTQISDPFED